MPRPYPSARPHAWLARHTLTLPRYPAIPRPGLPPVFSSHYPYARYHEIGATSTPFTLELIDIENEILRISIAWQLGGRVFSIIDKRRPDTEFGEPGAELLFRPDVLKPAQVKPLYGWLCGGIEVSFPEAHTPTNMEPVGWRSFQDGTRAVVEVGETERAQGLQWLVQYSLGPGEDFLTQRWKLHNPTRRTGRWHAWSNAAVRSTPETEPVYPPGKTLLHGKDATGHWPDGWTRLKEVHPMYGLFWENPAVQNFGAFHHELGFGLMHMARPDQMAGMKLWVFGDSTPRWAESISDRGRCYIEIQAGHFVTQKETAELLPGQSVTFEEFWAPLSRPAEVFERACPIPRGGRRNIARAVMFGDAHIPGLSLWRQVKSAHRDRAPERLPSELPEGCWPPPTQNLLPALRWAARHRPLYQTALATLHAAAKNYPRAMRLLQDCRDPAGVRLRGLIAYKIDKNLTLAAQCLEAAPVQEDAYWEMLDQIYADLQAHDKRVAIQAQFRDSQKSWARLRRADLALALDQPKEALAILLEKPWPRVHEEFRRSALWVQAHRALGLPWYPIPVELGEDPVDPDRHPADQLDRRRREP